MTDEPGQQPPHHQVRFGWGRGNAERAAVAADVLVWVDAVVHPSTPSPATLPPGATVLAVDLPTAFAAAEWIAARQVALQRRLAIHVVAAGAPDGDVGFAYAIEDHLAAGALIARLVDLGIDAISPEAAVADAGYRGLADAIGPLVTASLGGAAGIDPGRLRIDRTLDPSSVRPIRPDRGVNG